MTIERVLLDMDGVLCDFMAAASKVHGRTYREADWPPGCEDFVTVFGISTATFWKAIDEFDEQEGFWSRLKPYPWFEDLIAMIRPFGFTIATSPNRHAWCPSGKVEWLHEHFHNRFMDFMIGREKHLLARSGHVLIDDRDKVCEQFSNEGGHVILFPQPWNSNHALTSHRLKYVWGELQRLNAL